ncbi:MAG TPA: hypothetical protein VGN32_17995 [Ktedonobacterales bacterium]|jgi:hypothetical protein|nr:hypothetical protein [Ktedonobacterales bacterium]
MGKYKQWLHHQEVGRRLRDQIANLEQERQRVQKMAPGHPTTLPDTDNPLIAALLTYTRQGNSLSPSGAGTADGFKSAASFATASASMPGNSGGDPALVANLMARADQMSADPLDQARAPGDGHGADGSAGDGAAPAGSTEGGESMGGWWQRYRPDDQA